MTDLKSANPAKGGSLPAGQSDASSRKEVKAYARYIHVSPRKLRLVADLVRKQPVEEALEQLRFSSKKAASPLYKVISSAVANAIHNFNLNKEDLFVKSLTIDGGPVYKRYSPRAQGRAFTERKRTSHINVVLEARDQKRKKKVRSIFSIRPKSETEAAEVTKTNLQKTGEVNDNKSVPKQAPRGSEKRKNNLISLKRRLFNRKSGV